MGECGGMWEAALHPFWGRPLGPQSLSMQQHGGVLAASQPSLDICRFVPFPGLEVGVPREGFWVMMR